MMCWHFLWRSSPLDFLALEIDADNDPLVLNEFGMMFPPAKAARTPC